MRLPTHRSSTNPIEMLVYEFNVPVEEATWMHNTQDHRRMARCTGMPIEFWTNLQEAYAKTCHLGGAGGR